MPLRSVLAIVRGALASCYRNMTQFVCDAHMAVELVSIQSDAPGGAVSASKDSRPWLRVKTKEDLPVGRWISISYSASLYDELVRPVIRFKTSAGDRLELLPAPLFGRGIWVGHLPFDTIEISISPTEQPESLGFRMDTFAVLPIGWILVLAVARHPLHAMGALLAACGSSPNKALELLSTAIRSRSLRSYDGWRRRRLRAIEPNGLDCPRHDRRDGPHIRVVIHIKDGASERAVARTLTSLSCQDYANWSLMIISGSNLWLQMANDLLAASGRHVVLLQPDAQADVLSAQLTDDAFVVPLIIGGTMPSYGLSAIANFSIAHPHYEIIYADEDRVDHRGAYHSPLLKPDWSPAFQHASPYVGHAIYLRRAVLSYCKDSLASQVVCSGSMHQVILSSAARIGHLRRVLLTLPLSEISELPVWASSISPMTATLDRAARVPLATIIIPSRDRADLLEACLKSLAKTRLQTFEIVIVDNDSDEPETLSLYERLKVDPRIRILYRPGLFNFSALCNWGANTAKTPVIVFLNNDIVIRTSDWLQTLVSWTLRSGIGAVGTKLAYPSGRLQHAGLVVGLGGYAGHVYRNMRADEPGYMRKLAFDREVSAVTGACLAVEKVKFESVGGFDERAFPVEFSDIDLCLRLSASGWKTICLCEPILTHHESATRGTARDMDVAYGHERRAFRNRWYRHIRDDPYFHPALSLHSVATALDQ